MKIGFLILGLILVAPKLEAHTAVYNDGNGEQHVSVNHANLGPTSDEIDNLNFRFEKWMSCNRNPDSDPDCTPCLPGDPFSFQFENLLAARCLPSQRDRAVVFNPNLTEEQKFQRDQQICECFQSRNGNAFENQSFEEGKRDVTRTMEISRSRREEEVRDRDKRTVERLLNERVMTALNAASYLNDAQNASQLAARYNVRPQMRSGIMNVWSQHMNELASQADSIEIGDDLFNATNQPQRFCIPYRHFLASKQFPEDEAFYSDIGAIEEFSERDWNYNEIMEQLRSVSNGRNFRDVMKENDFARRLFTRAKFLYDNPAFKNIFLSSANDTIKRGLFQRIRTIPRLDCTSGTCVRGPNWVEGANRYRTDMASFLNQNDVIQATHDGAIAARKTNYNSSQSRAGAATADDLSTHATADASSWGGLCASRERDRDQRRNARQNLVQFIEDVQTDYGERDFDHPAQDAQYVALNNEVCDRPRRNSSGQKTFNQFLADRCGRSREGQCHPINRPLMLADYNSQYPEELETTGRTALQTSILPFINGSIAVPVFSKGQVDEFRRVSSDPVLSRSSVSFSSTPQIASMELRRPIFEEIRNASTARPMTDQPVSIFNPNLPIQTVAPVDPVAIAQSRAEQRVQSVETIRNSISQNENGSRAIRDELSALRQTLIREREKNERGQPSEFSSINARIASLERNLEQSRVEKRELEARLARATEVQRTAPAAESEVPVERRRSSFASSAQASPQSTIQGPVSSGAVSAPAIAGGATLGGSSGGRAAPSASAIRSAPGTSLERFGVRSSTQQGAITVAAPSSSIDYNELRSQSGENVVPLSVSPEEFNQIANNDQSVFSRYLEQLKSMPGEVVRVNVTVPGDGRSLELFVVKNGDQISLVPGQTAGRSIASEGAIVPEKNVNREVTLKALQNELNQ